MTDKDLPEAWDAAVHWDVVMRREFESESDRASVILASAMLDNALATVLKARLTPCSTSEDPLFHGANAPLSSFSSRIEMAYRLSLVDANFARSLHLVRKIRNDFAHNVTGCNFADASVVSRLTELRRAVAFEYVLPETRASFPPGARGDFQAIAGLMHYLLHSLVETTSPLEDYAWSTKFHVAVAEADS